MTKAPTKARSAAEAERFSRKSGEDETRQALSLPATYINAMYPMTQRGILRIAFGEAVEGQTRFHTAIVMATPVARMLKDALDEAIAELDKIEAAG